MLKISPIQTKEQQKQICELCDVEFDADLLAYAAFDDNELEGVCQFKLTDKGGIIKSFAPTKGRNNRDALFVLGRGTLNFIDLCGVHYAIFDAEVTDEPLLLRIGFKKTDGGVFEMDLEGFFTSDHCH